MTRHFDLIAFDWDGTLFDSTASTGIEDAKQRTNHFVVELFHHNIFRSGKGVGNDVD